MYNVRNVTKDLYWIGGNDHRLALFENIHPIPKGVSYNSYLLLDKKTVLFDTVDWSICRDFLSNMAHVLDGRDLDYIVINHMEPDHGASLEEVLIRYPKAKIISTEKSFMLMRQFGFDVDGKEIQVKEGDTFSFGKHEVIFIEAPMVHWPEAMVTFDKTDGVLFSADAFGSFGALDGKLFNDEVNFDRDWIDEARRYYTNIVGKYGPFVQSLLKKATPILPDIKYICPLHGPVWRNDFEYLLDKYNKWSSYEPEEKAVMIAYASMYGNTEFAAQILATKLVERGIKNVQIYDSSKLDISYLFSVIWKYKGLMIGTCTHYNMAFPKIEPLLQKLENYGLKNRYLGIFGNMMWSGGGVKRIKEFANTLTGLEQVGEPIEIKGHVTSAERDRLIELANLMADKLIANRK